MYDPAAAARARILETMSAGEIEEYAKPIEHGEKAIMRYTVTFTERRGDAVEIGTYDSTDAAEAAAQGHCSPNSFAAEALRWRKTFNHVQHAKCPAGTYTITGSKE